MIDSTISYNKNIPSISMRLQHPSYELIKGFILNKNNQVSLYGFIKALVCQYIELDKIIYKKNSIIEFKNKIHPLKGEIDTDNREVIFFNNYKEDNNVNFSEDNLLVSYKSVREYINKYKGLIIENMSIEEISILDIDLEIASYLENNINDNFNNMIMYLSKKFNNSIVFMTYFNGILIIKGNEEEYKIYTTLKDEDLPDILKNLKKENDTKSLSLNLKKKY